MEEELSIMNWEYEKHLCKYSATHIHTFATRTLFGNADPFLKQNLLK